MKILFTGASSFSGMWFVKALVDSGHEVIPVLRFPYHTYNGIRKARVDELLKISSPIFDAPFGYKPFLDAINSSSSWDLLCHHGADVVNYKSPDFNPITALANNTHNLKIVLEMLKQRECFQVILTGSVFENKEGTGSDALHAVSPYGLSKGLTSDTFAFYTSIFQMKLGKFVIPNPFGPLEEARYTSYLARQWLSGQKPTVNTPQYVRDNIPISLLALSYAEFASKLHDSPGFSKCNPSFYVESQASFTERFSNQMQQRWDIKCPYDLKQQVEFTEPLMRINTDRIHAEHLGWNDSQFWDELANYYLKTFK